MIASPYNSYMELSIMIINNRYLEGLILSIISEEENGIYAYRIANVLCDAIKVSESTIYTICNRLVIKELLSNDTVSEIVNGRIRKNYRITQKGIEMLNQMKNIYQTEKEVLDRWLGN